MIYISQKRAKDIDRFRRSRYYVSIKSDAKTVNEIIEELKVSKVSERSGRAMDHEEENVFEKLRSKGIYVVNKKFNDDEVLNVVIVGHVDHGKSSFIGRLLYDIGEINDEKVNELKKASQKARE